MSKENKPSEPNINIKADFTEILNSSPKGAKYIFNILFGKKHAEAERRIRLSNAQDYADMKKIISGEAVYDNEKNQITVPSHDIKSLIVSALQDEEITNLIGCIKSTSHYIDDVSDEESEPSQDFINRWRNDAKLIDDESIQYVWGRILAEEINAPKTVSIRTLDVIKNLSKEEAEIFSESLDFIFYNSYLIDNGDENNSFIPADKARKLNDAGLMTSFTPGMYHQGTWLTQRFVLDGDAIPKVFYLSSSDKYFFIDADKVKEEPKVKIWELTNAGKELYEILKKGHTTKEESVKQIIDWILKDTNASEFYYGNIIKTSDNKKSVEDLKTVTRNK
ncbi:DUF2806 domain-containing protein [Enterobacter cloacae]|uniref:DUF2806 domain-containing protein n=1 Tax=Enterobacter cloacae TaxID=550 RepID=UPI001EE5CA46|nr:DUF2806 domain-containing protein [Enterobacter cloacae]UKW18274.1 DUF2806 domain-containing protein [Enterobacter cloacae]HEB0911658.1 DUF2806 domain-containing protein [Enterobacter cloacae]HEB0931713.1 DUF2806 domain-containing protein [Enterobacter cloacae]HEB0947729.1 DUF2806 domain-containing protein [Enterobacter cloacae]HEB0967849.1 DUF2806 domain-containing protein [Enterobacter cloacae]